MKVCEYARMQACKYEPICKYAHIRKYARMHVCRYARILTVCDAKGTMYMGTQEYIILSFVRFALLIDILT